ncbi:MAG TPA: hypothetical protein VF075_12815 [Pyrinomonadaceae bacterium]
MPRKYLLLLCLVCAMAAACNSAKVETATTSRPVAAASTASANKPGRQPTEAELRDAITRNYKDAVTIDNSQSVPFLTGDFNGDNSEDIAIIVKPGKGKLSELNSEYANWILEDPHQPPLQERRPRPISIRGNDVLLAVIHGYEGDGWRNALATQTYLLKNAVGEEFQTQTAQHVSGAKVRGDVIREKLDGANGIILWTGAKYVWHPVS